MGSLIIRQATESDFTEIMNLIDNARIVMSANGNPRQWREGHPSAEQIHSDIRRHASFLISDGDEIVGTFAFSDGPEPTYARITGGQWLDDSPYSVVHRIAGRARSHGVFKTMLAFCLARTENIRIDTHCDNHIMRHLLSKHGFVYCGVIHLPNGDARLAYQRHRIAPPRDMTTDITPQKTKKDKK